MSSCEITSDMFTLGVRGVCSVQWNFRKVINIMLNKFGYSVRKVFTQLDPGTTMILDSVFKTIDVLISDDQSFALTCNGFGLDLKAQTVKYQLASNISNVYALTFQSDRNLVMFDTSQKAVWSSGIMPKSSAIRINSNGALLSDTCIITGDMIKLGYSNVCSSDWKMRLAANNLLKYFKYSTRNLYTQLTPGTTMTIDTNNKLMDVLISDDLQSILLSNGNRLKNRQYNMAQQRIDVPYTLVFQLDKNLVMFDSNNKAIWSTGTDGNASIVKLVDDKIIVGSCTIPNSTPIVLGQMNICSREFKIKQKIMFVLGEMKPKWYKVKKLFYQLKPGDVMSMDVKNNSVDVLVSKNESFALTCNGFILDLNTQKVKSQIQGDIQNEYSLIFQMDNNFVMKNAQNVIVWSTGILKNGSVITLGDSGNIIAN